MAVTVVSGPHQMKASAGDVVLAPLGDGTGPLPLRSDWPMHEEPADVAIGAVRGREIHFSPRTLIFLEGDLVDWVYQIADGVIILYKLLPDGRRQVVELLGPGDVFGFSPISIHNCSAETLTDARCMGFDRGAIERSPALMRRLSSCLYVQISLLHEHAMLLGRKSALERMTSFLMRLVPDRGGLNCPGPPDAADHAHVRLAMSRQEIADYLGLTIETVSRTLTKLKRCGIVAISKLDEISVHDVCRLCRLTGTHFTRGRWCGSREKPLIKDPWS